MYNLMYTVNTGRTTTQIKKKKNSQNPVRSSLLPSTILDHSLIFSSKATILTFANILYQHVKYIFHSFSSHIGIQLHDYTTMYLSIVDRNLGYSQFVPLINNGGTNILGSVSWETHIYIPTCDFL